MGRKSRRKQNAREMIGSLRVSERWQKVFAYSIILPSVGLIIWALKLMDETFIPERVVLITVLAAATAGSLSVYFIWRKYTFPIGVVVFYGSLFGCGIGLFSLFGGNYYFRDQATFEATSPILKIGRNTYRHSRDCSSIYVVVQYEKLGNKVKFPCHLENVIGNYRQVRLQLSEGFFGYYIVRGYELISP